MTTVWLGAGTLTYPEGGGHLWVYLNWALGLRSAGCDVVWLESVEPGMPPAEVGALVAGLRARLEPFGLADSIALTSKAGEDLPSTVVEGCVELETASEAAPLLNLSYDACAAVTDRFRRTALVDIDPGLLQVWLSEGVASLPRHDVYFSIGETVGRPDALFPDGGIQWQYTPPCVALDRWPVCRAADDAPFTTVSHWATRQCRLARALAEEWFDARQVATGVLERALP